MLCSQDMAMGFLPRRSKVAGSAALPLILKLIVFAFGTCLSLWVRPPCWQCNAVQCSAVQCFADAAVRMDSLCCPSNLNRLPV